MLPANLARRLGSWLRFQVFAWAGLALGILLLAVTALGFGTHSALTESPAETATGTASPTVTSTATATATPSPTSTPTRLPDRKNCDKIRGTEYRSRTERARFLDHCVTPTPQPTATPEFVAAGRPAAPPEVRRPAANPPRNIEALVCSYPWNCSWALSVMYCESGGNPNAYNPAGPYIGLFQILSSDSSLFDPVTNVAAAYQKYVSQGPGAWGACA
jgi:hypothetical protein